MKLPREQRSLSALRTMLGMSDSGGVGARLVKWTSEGNLGWAFDNEEDSMSLEARSVGFDMTDFLENANIRTPVMLHLFERIEALLTGESMVIAIDDFRTDMADPALTDFAPDAHTTKRPPHAYPARLRLEKGTERT